MAVGRKRGVVVLVGSLLLASPFLALADGKDTQADQRYDEGLAFFKKSDFENARQSFVQAYALVPKTRYLWNLSIAEYKSGHLADAMNHIRTYLRSGEADAADRQRAGLMLTDAIKQTVQIKVSTTAGARVLIDGVLLREEAPLPDVIAVSAGKHKITAKLVDREKSTDIEGKPGDSKDVELDLGPAPLPSASATTSATATTTATATSSPTTTASAIPTAPPASNTPKIVAGATLAGIGVIGLVFGGVFAGVSNGAKSDREALAAQGACASLTSATCDDWRSKADQENTYHTLSLVSLISGAAIAAGGIAVLIWGATSSTTVSAAPTNGGMSLVLRGAF